MVENLHFIVRRLTVNPDKVAQSTAPVKARNKFRYLVAKLRTVAFDKLHKTDAVYELCRRVHKIHVPCRHAAFASAVPVAEIRSVPENVYMVIVNGTVTAGYAVPLAEGVHIASKLSEIHFYHLLKKNLFIFYHYGEHFAIAKRKNISIMTRT
mgnify:CR=1 FL=1